MGGQGGNRPAILTNEQGGFTFTGLPPGGYTVSADKATYMSASYPDRGGSLRSSAARPVLIQGDQTVDNVVVRLYHGGAISGRVVDAHGDPVEFAQVSALAMTASGAGRMGMRGQMQTNDIGEFRIGRLMPGRYILMVSSQNRFQDPMGNETPLPQPVPTYFPNAMARNEAQPVLVARGQTLSGVEIAMGEGVPTVVTGRVIVSDGQPLAPTPGAGGVFVNARPDDRDFQGGMQAGSVVRPDGTFRFLLAPGNYILEARRNQPGGPGTGNREQYGIAKVSVAGETMDVSIVLGSGATASGRVVFEGETPPPNPPTQTSVPMSSPDGIGNCRSGQLQIAPDWTFSVDGLVGICTAPTYGMFGRWTLKSIVINNQDLRNGSVTFEPGQHYGNVQIVVTDRKNELNLHVTDEKGQPTREYAVLVFPIDKSRWELASQAVRTFVPPSIEMMASMQATATASGRGNLPAQMGREIVSGLTAGEYYTIALDDIDNDGWRDPAVLERLATAATRVTMSEGPTDVNLLRVKLEDVIR
jgi:protocatechuate 3,4-dioxygenase beta subunit